MTNVVTMPWRGGTVHILVCQLAKLSDDGICGPSRLTRCDHYRDYITSDYRRRLGDGPDKSFQGRGRLESGGGSTMHSTGAHSIRHTFHTLCVQIATKCLALSSNFFQSRGRCARLKRAGVGKQQHNHYGEVRHSKFPLMQWRRCHDGDVPGLSSRSQRLRGPRELIRGSTDMVGHVCFDA